MKSYSYIIATLAAFGNFITFVTANTEIYLNTYGECNSVPSSEEESQTFCNTIFNSEKCQNYYNNPEKVIGENYDELDIATVHYHREKAKVACQLDDTNTKCPIGQYYIDVTSDSSVNEDDYILKSCRSKVCIDATTSYIAAKEKYYALKYPNKMESFSKKFKSQNELLKCTDVDAINKANEVTTGASDNSNGNTGGKSDSTTSGTSSKTDDKNNKSSSDKKSNAGDSNINKGVTNDNTNNDSNIIGNANNVDSNVNDGGATTANDNENGSDQPNTGESISLDKKITLSLLVGFILINIFFL